MVALFSGIAAAKSCHGKQMKIKYTDLRNVEPKDLIDIVTQLESFRSASDRYTEKQIDTLFSEISLTSTLVLHTLELWCVRLTSCCKYALAKAVCKLHTVVLYYTQLTTDQTTKLLTTIEDDTDHRLHTLNLRGNSLTEVSGEVLSRAVCNLHTVDLESTQLTPDQVNSLLTTMHSISVSRLQILYLPRGELGRIPLDLKQLVKSKVHIID